MRQLSRLTANLAATAATTAAIAAAIILAPAGGAAKAETDDVPPVYAGRRAAVNRDKLPQAKAPATAAEGDKSLGPDGKPWTAESITLYMHGKLKKIWPFTVAKELEMEIGEGKKKKWAVVSTTPAKEKLLDQIERKHKMDRAPGRGILVFDKRDTLLDALEDPKHPNHEQYRKVISQPFAKAAADGKAQDIYWLNSIELVDFHGDQEAADEYSNEFKKLSGVGTLRCEQWGAVVVTGSSGPMPFVIDLRDKYPGYSPTATGNSN